MTSTLLDIKETAPLIKCSEITLRRLIYSGKIGYKKIGSRYFFTQEHIDAFLKLVEHTPKAAKTGQSSSSVGSAEVLGL